jgi:hypothetical protein
MITRKFYRVVLMPRWCFAPAKTVGTIVLRDEKAGKGGRAGGGPFVRHPAKFFD